MSSTRGRRRVDFVFIFELSHTTKRRRTHPFPISFRLPACSSPGSPIELASYQDPHLAAVLIKKFFREMNEPLFHEGLYELIGRCPRVPYGEEKDGRVDEKEEVVRFVKETLFS